MGAASREHSLLMAIDLGISSIKAALFSPDGAIVAIENLDYLDVIKKWDAEDACFYLDPPYEGVEKAYYDLNKKGGFDHQALRNAIETTQGSVVVSYYKSDTMLRLYEGFEVLERPSTNQIGKVRRPVTEVLFIRCSQWAKEQRSRPHTRDIFADAHAKPWRQAAS